MTQHLGGFNLLHYREKRAVQQRYKHGIGIAIASSIGILMAIAMQYKLLHTTHLHTIQRAQLEQTLTSLKPQLALSKALMKPIKAQHARTHLAASLSQQMDRFSDLLQALEEIEPIGIRLLDLHFQPDFSTIVGTARTQRTLRDWVRHLKRIGPFLQVSVTQVQRLKRSKSATPTIEKAPAYIPVRPPLPPAPFIQPFSSTPPSAAHQRTHEFAFTLKLEDIKPPPSARPNRSL